MDELIYYNAKGDSKDKNYSTAFSYLVSLHSTKTYHQYRQAPSSQNSSANLSVGHGSHLLVSLPNKSLLHVYLYGKESPEQRIPLPEILTSLKAYIDPQTGKPTFLLGGSITGKLYIWSLNSGLLIKVKQPHYQPLTSIAIRSGFVATAGKDSRVVVHTLTSLLLPPSAASDKPFAIITDHTLPVTSLQFTQGLNNDIKLYSSSLDSTVRVYFLSTNTAILTTTFVAPEPVTAMTFDPAFRSMYLGLSNGHIRAVPLFSCHPKTHILEAVGGLGKIVTIMPDPELEYTFTCHTDYHFNAGIDRSVSVTQLKVSFDGTLLVSGDSEGCLFIIDVTTKQISKKLKQLVGEISALELFPIEANDKRFERTFGVDKTIVRNIPVLKRVPMEEIEINKEEIVLKLDDGLPSREDWDFENWMKNVTDEERVFTNFTGVESNVIKNSIADFEINVSNDSIKKLQQELSNKENAMDSLKLKYNELLKEYTDVISK